MSELCLKISPSKQNASPSKQNAANMPISPAFLVGAGLAHIAKCNRLQANRSKCKLLFHLTLYFAGRDNNRACQGGT
jgi:hypothetical protein